jgi:hypothetical protein
MMALLLGIWHNQDRFILSDQDSPNSPPIPQKVSLLAFSGTLVQEEQNKQSACESNRVCLLHCS